METFCIDDVNDQYRKKANDVENAGYQRLLSRLEVFRNHMTVMLIELSMKIEGEMQKNSNKCIFI